MTVLATHELPINNPRGKDQRPANDHLDRGAAEGNAEVAVADGGNGAPSLPYKVTTDGQEDPLPPIASTDLQAGELLLHLLSGGGGYGDPLLREPERVREDVLSQFISFERARDVYGVVFENTELSDALAIDEEGTTRQREMLRVGR